MKGIGILAIWLGVISLVVGLISRLVLKPIPVIGGLEAQAFLLFANTCFLAAILIQLSKCK